MPIQGCGLQGIVAQIHWLPWSHRVASRLWLAGNRRSDTLWRSTLPPLASAVACRESSLRYTSGADSNDCPRAVACRESSLRYTASSRAELAIRAVACRESSLRYTSDAVHGLRAHALWLAGNRRSDTLQQRRQLRDLRAVACRESSLRYTCPRADSSPFCAVACRESSLRYTNCAAWGIVDQAVACRESSLRYTGACRTSCPRCLLWLAGNRRSDTLQTVIQYHAWSCGLQGIVAQIH